MVSHEIPEDLRDRRPLAMLHEGLIVETGAPGHSELGEPHVQRFIRGEVEATNHAA